MNNKEEIKIIHAKKKDEFEIGKRLIREYFATLDFDVSFQDIETELQEMDKQYFKPGGGLILLKYCSEYFGCTGIRKISDGIAELKRMYLKEQFRGRGYGKLLLNEALKLAGKLSYEKVRLDTIKSMKAANNLYKEAGSYEIPPYRYNPVKDAMYFELSLK